MKIAKKNLSGLKNLGGRIKRYASLKGVDEIFEERNCLNNLSHDSIAKMDVGRGSKKGRFSAYAGFDPTSGKLHLGNMAQIVSLVRSGQAGFDLIGLIGGATARIGDPSGKNSERNLLSFDQVDENRRDMTLLLDNLCRNVISVANERNYQGLEIINPDNFCIVDNLDFYKDMNVLDFLTQVGKSFSVNTMMSRHSVASRLDSGDGISFTEFSYQVLQGYDFYQLFGQKNCILQIGGSDQWGNISSGIDLVRRLEQEQVFGLTTNLLVTKEGKKFGKSEGNAIWVDDETKSLLALHNYIMSLPDDQIPLLLQSLTFISNEEIKDIESKSADGQIRAQEALSRELLAMVTGSRDRAESVLRYKKFFKLKYEQFEDQSVEEIKGFFEGILQCKKMSMEEFNSIENLEEVMIEIGVRDSFNQIRKMVKGNGLAINGVKVSKQKMKVNDYPLLSGCLWVVKYGKRDYLSLIVE